MSGLTSVSVRNGGVYVKDGRMIMMMMMMMPCLVVDMCVSVHFDQKDWRVKADMMGEKSLSVHQTKLIPLDRTRKGSTCAWNLLNFLCLFSTLIYPLSLKIDDVLLRQCPVEFLFCLKLRCQSEVICIVAI